MSTTASGRDIFTIGKYADKNREVVIQEDGSVHDLPAGAEVTYADDLAEFPYVSEL